MIVIEVVKQVTVNVLRKRSWIVANIMSNIMPYLPIVLRIK